MTGIIRIYIYRIYSIIYIIMTIYSQTVICFIKQRYICYFMTTTKAYQQSNYTSQLIHNIYNKKLKQRYDIKSHKGEFSSKS